ncbi:energy transducer TonB [Sphingomonas ginkgonis]|uniref:Energy transducer TonB n=1 Tax=Sphingomonas ginkgonis TaxID=2315330 RepID=A0A3R9YKZ4_9SPHN|nr:energy transducer TonB [Sphingomonas ginkgonis]RST32194.1 energy transducer TonB [Sphingomonas ginkgonis]
MRRLTTALLGAALMIPQAAAAEPLQPTARWNVDISEAQCVATRPYGAASTALTLGVKQPALGGIVQLIFASPHASTAPFAIETGALLSFDEDPPIKIDLLFYDVLKAGKRILLANIPRHLLEEHAGARLMTIHSKGLIEQQFALSDTGPLLKVLGDCGVDLRHYWNIEDDAEQKFPLLKEDKQPGKAHHATADLSNVLQASDYPGQAALRGQAGTVRLALLVDDGGSVADCTVIETSGVAVLDAQGCQAMRNRARFEPAADATGKPRRDGVLVRIRWEMPSD